MFLLGEISAFTNLTFVEAESDTATLRWGRFDDPLNLAYAYGPSSFEAGGDQWFANNENPDPVIGEGVSHIMRHELGHALGLSHPHEGAFGVIPPEFDSIEYSTMSYRLHTDQREGDYSGRHYEQSFMMLDIAALQHLYGANFTVNATDTVYTFDPETGQMFINGVGEAVPYEAFVLRTIWDGGGIDTYDFSNFQTDQVISLVPGGWSTFDESLLAILVLRGDIHAGPLTPIYAAGNLANALQYQGDARSLIENAIGGSGDDVLIGNAAINVLTGRGGDDTYYIQNAGDRVVEANNQGYDQIYSTVSYSLAGTYVERLILTGTAHLNATGNSLANHLVGNSGNNVLNGGTGADVMEGGRGDDTYYVDNVGDRVVEANNQGFDQIFSSVSLNLAGTYVERLVLTGTANLDATGNSLANRLSGNDGANILDGKGGADQMAGGKGDDIYIVDNVGDRIYEFAGEGFDEVRASVSYTLSAHVERLVLTGSGNIDATGNSLANRLVGNSGANVLDGKGGADQMAGGKGDDTYIVDNVADRIYENRNEGRDLIISSVNYSLERAANVEDLTLSGSARFGTGNALNNTLTGNAGANTLDGGAGNDILIGGRGQDALTGGTGADTFVFQSLQDSTVAKSDRITDLEAHDIIDLSAIDANTSVSGNQAFALVDAFTGQAGQATLSFAGGVTFLNLDVNGDGVSDFLLRIQGDHRSHENWAW